MTYTRDDERRFTLLRWGDYYVTPDGASVTGVNMLLRRRLLLMSAFVYTSRMMVIIIVEDELSASESSRTPGRNGSSYATAHIVMRCYVTITLL